jgi:Family of unknown function (DUF5989)
MLDFAKELWIFLRSRKKYWVTPVFLMVCIIGGLVVLAEASAIAPFVYTLF